MTKPLYPWSVTVEMPDWDASRNSFSDLERELRDEDGVRAVLDFEDRRHALVPPSVRIEVAAGRTPASAARVAERAVGTALASLGQASTTSAWIISTDDHPP